MQSFEINAQVRQERGKTAARTLRRQGLIPAVIYGGDGSVALTVSPKEMSKALSTEYRRNVVFTMKIDNKDKLALVKDIQQDALSGAIEHIDFYQIQKDAPVDVDVPLVTVGRAAGVVAGGHLGVMYRKLPIRTLPDNIPAKIEVDVTHVELHGHIHVDELPLPKGVEARLPAKTTVISVQMLRRQKEAEEAKPGADAAAAAATGSTPPAAGSTPPPAAKKE